MSLHRKLGSLSECLVQNELSNVILRSAIRAYPAVAGVKVVEGISEKEQKQFFETMLRVRANADQLLDDSKIEN